MASGDTICVAIGEGSIYCIPSRGPLVAMPTPRPAEINQSMDQSVDQICHCDYLALWPVINMIKVLCGNIQVYILYLAALLTITRVL